MLEVTIFTKIFGVLLKAKFSNYNENHQIQRTSLQLLFAVIYSIIITEVNIWKVGRSHYCLRLDADVVVRLCT